MLIFLKSGSLKVLEIAGPVQSYIGIAVPFPRCVEHVYKDIKNYIVDNSILSVKRFIKLQTKIFVCSSFTSSNYNWVCCRLITNGLICGNCNCCLYTDCANTRSCLIERSIQWDCMTCNYQEHARYQEGRIRYLE